MGEAALPVPDQVSFKIPLAAWWVRQAPHIEAVLHLPHAGLVDRVTDGLILCRL